MFNGAYHSNIRSNVWLPTQTFERGRRNEMITTTLQYYFRCLYFALCCLSLAMTRNLSLIVWRQNRIIYIRTTRSRYLLTHPLLATRDQTNKRLTSTLSYYYVTRCMWQSLLFTSALLLRVKLALFVTGRKFIYLRQF